MSMTLNKHLNSYKSIAIALGVLMLVVFTGHQLTKKSAPSIPIPNVIVQKPELKEVVEYVTQTGTTVAYNAVNLVARIEGFLNAIQFTDGSFVKKGRGLFVIQPEPYQEKLNEANASVAAQKAGYAYAKSEYARQQRMYKQNATSLNNVEKWFAKVQESEAEVAKAIANQEIAKINYSYTHILAPFDGRIGRHLIDVGNLVGNGKATNLATIEQIDPLYVYFNLNELDLIKLRAAAKAQGMKPGDINKIPVYIQIQTEDDFKFMGHLDFVDTGLNASTGTMEFRALLDNKDYVLVPGLFVQVRVPVSAPQKQLLVPETALLYDQAGPYLMVINEANEVQVRRVELGTSEKGKRAITKGLGAQDKVIVSGLQYVTPGNKVNPQEQPQAQKD